MVEEQREKKYVLRAQVGVYIGGIGLFLVFCIYTIIRMIFPPLIGPHDIIRGPEAEPILSFFSLFFALLVGVVAGYFAAKEERLVVAKDGARIGAWVGGIAGSVMYGFGPLVFAGPLIGFFEENLPIPFVATWITDFYLIIMGLWEWAAMLIPVVSALGGAAGGYLRASSATAEGSSSVE